MENITVLKKRKRKGNEGGQRLYLNRLLVFSSAVIFSICFCFSFAFLRFLCFNQYCYGKCVFSDDETRLILKDKDETDYINANIIDVCRLTYSIYKYCLRLIYFNTVL